MLNWFKRSHFFHQHDTVDTRKLFERISKGDLSLDVLLRQPLYSKPVNQHGDTAFLCAIREGYFEIVRPLLESRYFSKYFLLIKNNNGESALVVAALYSSAALFRLIMKSQHCSMPAMSELVKTSISQSFPDLITTYLAEDPVIQIIKRLLAYVQISKSFWQGWKRHHSTFIKTLLENDKIRSRDEIKQAFQAYIQNPQVVIDPKGDFATICQFLEIPLSTNVVELITAPPIIDSDIELSSSGPHSYSDIDYVSS